MMMKCVVCKSHFDGYPFQMYCSKKCTTYAQNHWSKAMKLAVVKELNANGTLYEGYLGIESEKPYGKV